MKRPNNLTISLPQQRLEQLEKLSQQGETIGQTAKRLLIEVLDAQITSESSIAEGQLQVFKEELGERIEQLETILLHQPEIINDLSERVKRLESLIEPKKEAASDSGQNHSQPLDGLTNPQLAKRMNVTRNTVFRWSKKGTDPSGKWTWRDGLWFEN